MCLNGSAILHSAATSAKLYERWPGSRVVSVIMAVLSMLASVFIIASFVMSQDLRRATSRRIVVFISIADFVSCLSNTVGALHHFDSGTGCSVQAIFTTVSTLSFMFWTTTLAVYLYMSIVLDKVQLAKKLMPLFHFIGWVLPLIIGMTAYSLGGLGDSLTLATDGWCWVSVEPRYPASWRCKHAMLFWMLFTMKGWELASYVIVPALYILIKVHIRRNMTREVDEPVSQGMKAALATIDRKLIIVPLAYVILRVWGTVRTFNFIFNRYGDGQEIPPTSRGLGVLNYLQALGDNGQGLVNFLLFVVFTRKVRITIGDWLRCCTCACCVMIQKRVTRSHTTRTTNTTRTQSTSGSLKISSGRVAMLAPSERTRLLRSQGVEPSPTLIQSVDDEPNAVVTRSVNDGNSRVPGVV
eukprot:scpid54762/ scgid6179/ Probable G-protein coupled receptor 157